MNIGKISEPVLKCSVLKQLKKNQECLLQGADIGMDCALFKMSNEMISLATASASGEKGDDAVAHAILRATNNLAAGGTLPVAVQLHLMLPERMREIALKRMMEAAMTVANRLNVTISGGHTEVLTEIKKPIVSVTAMGVNKQEGSTNRLGISGKQLCKCGQQIVMTKWIGISATALLAKEKEKELLQRYPKYFVKSAQGLEQYYSILQEAVLAKEDRTIAMHDVAGGGIYAALWELAERNNIGIEVVLKKIALKQETVEICEFFNLNPYEIRSDGALLIITEDGEGLVNKMLSHGITATVIGSVTDNNDRIVVNDEEKRFLEPPRKEQILTEILN